MRLNAETLAQVIAAKPSARPTATGIVHFGPGAFHRAHQADFIDRLTSNGPLNTADHSVYFGNSPDGAAVGYTDFPTLADR